MRVANKYVQVDGVATFLYHVGPTTFPEHPPETAQGQTLVCLHDAGDNGNVFTAVLSGLSGLSGEGGHSPMAFDQPAHGRSGGLDSLGSVEALAAFSAAFCDKLGLGPAVFLGQGLGAAVAMQLAADRPDRVRALALCGAAARPVIPPALLAKLKRITEGKARREFDRSGYSPKSGRDVYTRAFTEWIKTDPRALYGDLLALERWGGCALPGVPTLVLLGEDESEAAGERSTALADILPNARMERIAKSGHRIALEQPEALCAALKTFLEELPA